MATIRLQNDFKELLKLLNSSKVNYLVVGGYAVGYHGYPRTTLDLDVWIEMTEDNAKRVISVLVKFGFGVPDLEPELIQKENQVIRMGNPPYAHQVINYDFRNRV